MINEFVEKLREKSALFSRSDFAVAGIAKDYKEAADIIEELSAKLASANIERSEQYYKGNSEFVEKLIERLEAQPTEQFVGIYGNHELVSAVIECCVECVNQLAEEYKDVSDTNVGKWIPVSEALPDEEGSYLVTFDDGHVSSAPFYDEDWELWGDSGEPVAWQPLPEPYKGE